MDLLKRFYDDPQTREAFKEFQLKLIQEMAVDRVLNKKAVAGVYEANKIIEQSFDKLGEIYGIIKESIKDSPR